MSRLFLVLWYAYIFWQIYLSFIHYHKFRYIKNKVTEPDPELINRWDRAPCNNNIDF